MTLAETKKETAPVGEMIPVIRAALASGKSVEMTVTGNSMKPLLRDRVSSVRLTRPDDLKKGDIVLFLRGDGHYVLHRILCSHGGLYDIVGDNQTVPDRNIPEENVIARVFAYSRDGVHWEKSDAVYQRWLALVKRLRSWGRRIKRKPVFTNRKG